jgi:hypothetical protein
MAQQQQDSSSAPRSDKRTERLAFSIGNLQCMRCGNLVSFEQCDFHEAVDRRFIVVVCHIPGCKMQDVRLKVPVRTIECEVL